MEAYFDNAATTKLNKYINLDEYKYYYGNPSSIYSLGQLTKEFIDNSRIEIANVLKVNPEDIFFTSGGTESNNWALQGIARKYKAGHIITTSIEHPSVLQTCKFLEKNNFDVTYLKVNKEGIIDLEDFKKSIREDTFLVSIMAVNNEIGSIQPINEIGEILKNQNRKIYFHVDATQAIYMDIYPENYNIDLLTFSGHKFHSPKGIGILYVKNQDIENLMYGGHQQDSLRPGTENAALIHTLNRCFSYLKKNKKNINKKLLKLNNYIRHKLSQIEYISFNSDKNCAKHIISIKIDGIDNERLLMRLANKKVYISAGSACNANSKELSYVLKEIGLSDEEIKNSIRISLSEDSTIEEIDYFIEALIEELNLLRGGSVIDKNDYYIKLLIEETKK